MGRKTKKSLVVKKLKNKTMKIKTYTCGNGEGMIENDSGGYVEREDYDKIQNYLNELFDLAYDNFQGLAQDDLYALVEKYEN